MLSIHCGRHSFCSHALTGGRSLTEVRDAAGHANIATTSTHLHAVIDDSESVGNMFAFASQAGGVKYADAADFDTIRAVVAPLSAVAAILRSPAASPQREERRSSLKRLRGRIDQIRDAAH